MNIVPDQDNIWFCTSGTGCFKVVNGKVAGTYLENKFVTSVFRDRENNLWFNTMGEGVYMIPSSSDFIKNYDRQSGLSANNITSLLPGAKDEFWLGYANGTVDKIENSNVITFKLNVPFNREFNRVTSLIIDSNRIFCGSDVGCFIIRGNKPDFILSDARNDAARFIGIPFEYSVKQLFANKKGDVYATHSSGLIQIIQTGKGYFAKNVINLFERTFAVTEYPDDCILVSGTKGLAEFVGEKEMVPFESEIDFSSIRILDMQPVGSILV